ncbi:hypothetical protein LUZ60_005663 [Juncus effusus]|nr:hypothetical protein LUZ60_005663 [Juncus effusus]
MAGEGILQKFKLYETRSNFYMVGCNKSQTSWRVLKIDRLEPQELCIYEDQTIYSEAEYSELIKRIHEGNRSTGGLKFVTKCYGIVGFVKFLGPYYMLLITKRRKVGTLCGEMIYAVAKSEIITLPSPIVRSNLAYSKDENRYKRLLCTVDLTKDFFFSYSYNLMRSLQKNVSEEKSTQNLYDTMFVWNEYLSRPIRTQLKNTIWTVALIHGFFKQSKFSVNGKEFWLTLIARRSRHFAGTRFLKRGVNSKGRVANDVETEQIISDEMTAGGIPREITSVVQNRGSIPLLWSQETSRLNIRPDIILEKDLEYTATRRHFDNLVARYGNPIVILNLIKTKEKKPRESLLRAEFAKAIHVINKGKSEENRLRFLHWDLTKHTRREGSNALAMLGKITSNAFDLTHLFHCHVSTNQAPIHDLSDSSSQNNYTVASSSTEIEEEESSTITTKLTIHPIVHQHGVLRTNCIDCLDRTNVAQFAYGLAALGHQLHALKLINDPRVDLDEPLANYLMEFYEKMGDVLALQYGGSAAHNKIFCERRGQWRPATRSQEIIRTIQRYYSNAYLDAEKQDAINIFLGHFQPQQGKPALWELGSDQHYNVGSRTNSLNEEFALSLLKRSLSDGNFLVEDLAPPVSSKNEETENVNLALPPKLSNDEIPELSDSAPDCTGNESGLPYSRLQLFQENRHSFLNELSFDESHSSNFLDLDWLSSSANSCEEEPYDRSSVMNSPAGNSSMENVIADNDQNGGDEMERELPICVPEILKICTEFSDRFERWVASGGTLCY